MSLRGEFMYEKHLIERKEGAELLRVKLSLKYFEIGFFWCANGLVV